MAFLARIMMALSVLAVCGAASTPDTLSDEALVKYAAADFDKAEKMGRRDVLGIHHGTPVIAEYRCGDVCPDYTTRIIHYDVEPGPACESIGGVGQGRFIPLGPSVATMNFCVPAALVEKKP